MTKAYAQMNSSCTAANGAGFAARLRSYIDSCGHRSGGVHYYLPGQPSGSGPDSCRHYSGRSGRPYM